MNKKFLTLAIIVSFLAISCIGVTPVTAEEEEQFPYPDIIIVGTPQCQRTWLWGLWKCTYTVKNDGDLNAGPFSVSFELYDFYDGEPPMGVYTHKGYQRVGNGLLSGQQKTKTFYFNYYERPLWHAQMKVTVDCYDEVTEDPNGGEDNNVAFSNWFPY